MCVLGCVPLLLVLHVVVDLTCALYLKGLHFTFDPYCSLLSVPYDLKVDSYSETTSMNLVLLNPSFLMGVNVLGGVS